jgi:hypothetical protein
MRRTYCCLIVFVVTALTTTLSKADIIYRHSGSNNPTTEGWIADKVLAPGNVGPISNDEGTGNDAWSVISDGVHLSDYTALVPANEWGADMGLGWTFSANLRIVSNVDFNRAVFTLISWVYRDPNGIGGSPVDQVELDFAPQPNGDPSVKIYGIQGPIPLNYTLVGGGSGYHLYQLQLDPTTNTLSFLVDGIDRFTGLQPRQTGGNPGVVFGCEPTMGDGQGNYNLVQLDIVPEPSTLVLLVGAVGLLLRRRATHC